MSKAAFSLCVGFGLLCGTIVIGRAQTPAEPLSWDAFTKECTAKPGETNAHLSFHVKNVSAKEVSINSVSTSCTCSRATLPEKPWRLAPGAEGEVRIAVDLRGRRGTLTKVAVVQSSTGPKVLTFKVNIPESAATGREKNQALAKADRQAVFKNDCAACHAQPTKGKQGAELYQKACGICHEAEHRATMVPDLRGLKSPTDREYWQRWVSTGKAGTLMPAFAAKEGGPLTDAQIKSLVEFLTKQFPAKTAAPPAR